MGSFLCKLPALQQLDINTENLPQAPTPLTATGKSFFFLYSTVNQDDGVSGDTREGQPVLGFTVMGPLMQAGLALSLLPH